jgi:type IV pilus assembly protein PilN
MIRINLVAEKKRKQAKTRTSSSRRFEAISGGKNIILIAILVIGAVVAGGWWWTLERDAAQWQVKLKEADQELKRLEDAIRKGEEYEAQKALLARKIELITNLKKRQTVPVHILDKVSRSLPEFVWLSTMSASNNQISISGKATTYNAVSNFYSSLGDAGVFTDVTLGRTFEVPEGVSFSLTCRFSDESMVDPSTQS